MRTRIEWEKTGGWRSRDGRFRIARDVNFGDWKLIDQSKKPSDPRRVLAQRETLRDAKLAAEEWA